MSNKYRKRFHRYMKVVLDRLPDDISDWVCRNVTFHETVQDDCVGFQFVSETKYHCVFPSSLFKLPIKARIFTMAHEIAHCYMIENGNGTHNEQDVDNLAKKWGFTP